MNFDKLALKVANKATWNNTPLAHCIHDEWITSFARRLREEWVKSLEPCGWKVHDGEIWFGAKTCPYENGMGTPIYTLEELTK